MMLAMSVTVLASDVDQNGEKRSIEEYVVILSQTEYVFTGEEKNPEVTVALLDDEGNIMTDTVLEDKEDYLLTYDNNVNAGEATVKVEGINEYEGNIEAKFNIMPASMEGAEIALEAVSYVYDGTEKTPAITVNVNGIVLNESDYEVTYSDNINAGTACVLVTGKGNYTGNATASYNITKAVLDDANVNLSKTSYVYNGNAKTPEVTVKVNGIIIDKSNYEVKYTNNKKVGVAAVTVSAIGDNCTGTKKVTFKINPKSTSVSITRGYDRLNVKWKKVSGVDGYQIWRSTKKDSGFKLVKTIKSVSTVKYTDTNVKHNTKYYYKVRAYQTVNGTKLYSDYSALRYHTVRVAQAVISGISKVDYRTLKIKWNAVKGATGYKVFRSTSKDGEYTKIATLGGNDTVSYTDDGLTCGKKYYYRVRAYRKIDGTKYHGTISAPKSSYPRPEKVKLTDDCTYKAQKATITWKKAAGAKGYEIYRSTTKNGTYKLVKTISSADTLKWTNTGLKKAQNYFYKVRAYCTRNGDKVYGVFSNIYQKRKAGWRYGTYDGEKVKYYYNADGEKVRDVSNLIGKQKSYVIKVNKQRATVTVYAKDGDNGYIIPVKAFVCSPGYTTPEGTFYTPQKIRWHELMGPCWGQWNTRITGSFLFHSVFYNSYHNNMALSVSAYNKLGTICSHGCVRLRAGDAKWIYDKCDLGTKVIIYNSSMSGPFGKPTADTLPYWHTWDPTDPNVKDECRERGCHNY